MPSPRPNVRRITCARCLTVHRDTVRCPTQFDEFEQAMRSDPDDCQGKTQAQETADSLRMLVVASAVALAIVLMWGLLYVVAVRPLSLPVTQEGRP